MAPYSMAGLLLAPQERVQQVWSASYHLTEETSRFILSTGTGRAPPSTAAEPRHARFVLFEPGSARVRPLRVITDRDRNNHHPDARRLRLVCNSSDCGESRTVGILARHNPKMSSAARGEESDAGCEAVVETDSPSFVSTFRLRTTLIYSRIDFSIATTLTTDRPPCQRGIPV